jgi:hypothetical protein
MGATESEQMFAVFVGVEQLITIYLKNREAQRSVSSPVRGGRDSRDHVHLISGARARLPSVAAGRRARAFHAWPRTTPDF